MTVRRMLSWIVALPLAVVTVGFAVANRQWVQVSLDPLTPADPWLALSMPLFGVLFLGVFLGIVVGWLGAWWKQGKWRKEARAVRRDLEDAQAERDRLARLAGPPPDLAG